jgi:hypothetical protein
MPAAMHKLLAWSPERAAALDAWLARGAELGVSFRTAKGQHSDAAAVGEALKRAAACRCGETKRLVPSVPEGYGLVVVSANPLRALREEAGLSQAEAGARCGMTRGAWANVEKAATATPAMVARARKGLARKSTT